MAWPARGLLVGFVVVGAVVAALGLGGLVNIVVPGNLFLSRWTQGSSQFAGMGMGVVIVAAARDRLRSLDAPPPSDAAIPEIDLTP